MGNVSQAEREALEALLAVVNQQLPRLPASSWLRPQFQRCQVGVERTLGTPTVQQAPPTPVGASPKKRHTRRKRTPKLQVIQGGA